MITHADVGYQVATRIERAGDEISGIDVAGVIDEFIATYGLVDVNTVGHDFFWGIVFDHLGAAATDLASPKLRRLIQQIDQLDEQHAAEDR